MEKFQGNRVRNNEVIEGHTAHHLFRSSHLNGATVPQLHGHRAQQSHNSMGTVLKKGSDAWGRGSSMTTINWSWFLPFRKDLNMKDEKAFIRA